MSRSTQFIGLTQNAQSFVKNLEELPSDTSTTGMFDEEIELRKWKAPDFLQNKKRTVLYGRLFLQNLGVLVR